MLIIVNPAAGGGRVRREWPEVARLLEETGVRAPHVFTTAPGHATELAAEAAGGGEDVIVVAGGDGTLCEAAEGLYRAGRGTLAMLPMGTGNDAGRTLGIPSQIEDAARVLLDGHTRDVDLIRVGDHIVLNAIGIGLLGDINLRAAKIKVVRGIAVYLFTAIASLFSYKSPLVRLETPDSSFEGTMTILAIHGGPTTGGGFRLTPNADPADGLLDACFVPGRGLLGKARRLVAGLRGTLGQAPGTVELRAPWIEITFSEPLPTHLDGNPIVLQPPTARFEVLPGALRVLAPPARVRQERTETPD